MLNTLRGTKTAFLIPKRYDEDTHPFYMGVPTPPRANVSHVYLINVNNNNNNNNAHVQMRMTRLKTE